MPRPAGNGASRATAHESRRATAEDRTPSVRRVSPAEYRANLAAMVAAAQSAGAQVVLLDLVLVGPVFRDTIAEVAAAHRVPWLDGREILRAGLAQILTPALHRRAGRARPLLGRGGHRLPQAYYDPAFYQRLFHDEQWRGLLRY